MSNASSGSSSGIPSVPDEVRVNTRAVLLSSKNGVGLKRFNRDYKKLLGKMFPWRKCGFPSAAVMLEHMPEVVRFEYNSMDRDYRLYGIGTKDMFMPSWVVKAQGIHKQSVSHPPMQPMLQASSWRVAPGGGHRQENECPLSKHLLEPLLQVSRNKGMATGNWNCSMTQPISKPLLQESSRGVAIGAHVHENGLTVGSSEGDKMLVCSMRGLISLCVKWNGQPQGGADVMKFQLQCMVSAISPPVEVNFMVMSMAFFRFRDIAIASRVMDCCNGKIVCGLTLSVVPAKEKLPLNGKRERQELRREAGSGRVEPRNEGAWSKSEVDMDMLRSARLNPVNVNHMLPQPVDESSRSCDQSHDVFRCDRVGSVPVNGGWDYMSEHSDSGDHDFRSHDQSIKHSPVTSLPASKGAGYHEFEPPDPNDHRMEHRRKMIEHALGLVSSDEEDDDSLLDFEWDETLFDDLPSRNSSRPFQTSATSSNDGTTPRGSSAVASGISSHTLTPERHPSSDQTFPALYVAMSSSLPLSTDTPRSLATSVSMDTPLPPLSVESPPLKTSTSPPPLCIETSPPPPLSMETQLPPLCLATSLSSSDEELPPLTIEAPEEGAVLSGSDLVPVTVSRVHSPSELWLQFTSDPKGTLDRMSEQMVEDNPPMLREVNLGSVCCVNINIGDPVPLRRAALPRRQPPRMRRALIVDNKAKHVGLSQVRVFLLDVGAHETCPLQNLFVLSLSLHPKEVPPLAFHYSLYGLVSTYPYEGHWSFLDNQVLWKHLHNRTVYMRHIGPVPALAARGREYVELYFDPDGKDNVVECIIEEGYYVARGNQDLVEQEDGMGMELATETGTELVESSLASVESSNRGNKRKHSLMAMVNSALERLAES